MLVTYFHLNGVSSQTTHTSFIYCTYLVSRYTNMFAVKKFRIFIYKELLRVLSLLVVFFHFALPEKVFSCFVRCEVYFLLITFVAFCSKSFLFSAFLHYKYYNMYLSCCKLCKCSAMQVDIHKFIDTNVSLVARISKFLTSLVGHETKIR